MFAHLLTASPVPKYKLFKRANYFALNNSWEYFLLYICRFNDEKYTYMVGHTLHDISLAYFKTRFPDSPRVCYGDDFYVMDIKLSKDSQPQGHPCRFDGYMLLYCVKGRIRLNVNLTEYCIDEGMIFMNVPGNIIRVNEILDVPKEEVQYVCVAMSKDFLQGMQLDANKIFNEGMSMMENPSVRLTEKELQMVRSGLEVLTRIVNSDAVYKREALLSLLSSMFYMLMGVWKKRGEPADPSQSTRSKIIFDQFIKLVSEYHTQYRNVGFYADKLCLTPKYLSKLIKNATGRSAPEWIDQYVILEAKNLLKYSGETIKESVFKLNFPNQSVFYKFFKALTGMTPTEYRNS